MNIKTVEITKINPAAYNPRKDLQQKDAEYQKLKKSIDKFDLVEPLIWNENTGNLIGGHQRLKILQERGDTEVDVSVVNLDDAEEKALNLALNKIGGSWEDGKLSVLLGELSALPDFDIELTGFDVDEVAALNPAEVVEDGFDAGAALGAIDEPVTKLGDIILLGRHRLMCGDSTDAGDVERLMDGKKANMVFTDPPYGINYSDLNKKFDKIKGDKDNPEKLITDVLLFTKNIPIYVCCNWQSFGNVGAAVEGAGFNVKSCIVWDKTVRIQNLDLYFKQHEFIIYSGPFGGQPTKDGDVWRIKRETRADHPTAKLLELPYRAINYSSKINAIVKDPFCGSGSTLIACEQTNRVCYAMELDPKYIDVCVLRWEEFTGQKAIRPEHQPLEKH